MDLPGLNAIHLRREQAKTLAAPAVRYGLLVTLLFGMVDLLYGRALSRSKFKVIEIMARVPTKPGSISPTSRLRIGMNKRISPGGSSSVSGKAVTSRTMDNGTC